MRIIIAYLFLFSAGVGNFLWKQYKNLQNILCIWQDLILVILLKSWFKTTLRLLR